MYNRKFDIKKDFEKLVELEYKISPIIRSIKNEEDKILLENYTRQIFNNQWKTKKWQI